MDKYPQLSTMGVLNPQQIIKYSVSSLNNIDYLIIVYARPKGSLLPKSRTYEFPRIQKKVKGKMAKPNEFVVLESSPEFTNAEKELKQILELKKTRQGVVEALQDQVDQLEKDIAMHTATLKTLIEQMQE